MNRYFVITFGFLPVFVIAGVVVLFTFGDNRPEQPAPAALSDRELALYREVRQKLLEHYDGELDEQALADKALSGLAAGTGDTYTRVNPPIVAKQQKIELKGSFYGIDCNIDYNEDGSIRITEPHPGGGGEKAGLLLNDVIVAVDGVSILGQPFEASRQRIQSDREGTVVAIAVLRGGDPKNGTDAKATKLQFDVERSQVVQHSVHDVHIETRDGRRFGYMAIEEFNDNTFKPLFTDAVAELISQGAEGLIIDLRFNGGGRVPPAVDLVDAFLAEKDALIVFTRSSRESNRKDDHTYRTRDDSALTGLPLVLLVDRGTASASEIFTGAMRDYGRAFIVGERTYGKGLVQTIFGLETDSRYSMNITTTRYYTPLGRRIQNGDKGEPGGVVPDLLISYRQGEQEKLASRLVARRARYNRDAIAKTSASWNFEDRMLDAALNVLAGKAAIVRNGQ